MTDTYIVPKVKALEGFDTNDYEYLLAVSSDGLYVLSPDKSKIVETVVDGKDNDGWVFSANSENDFLDAITQIKRDILDGINPLDYLL